MKILIAILSVIALGLAVFNATKIDFNEPFQGESVIAIITVLAACCAILLLQILRVSKKIEEKVKQN